MKTVSVLVRAGLLGAALAAVLAAPLAWGTVIELDYNGDPATDGQVVEPLPDNPGRTLGEQRRTAIEHATRLAERVVWIPNETSVTVRADWTSATLGNSLAAARAVLDCNDIDESRAPEIICHSLWLSLSQGKTFAPSSDAPKVEYNPKKTFNLSLDPVPGGPNYLVATALHEYIHHLGFYTLLPTAELSWALDRFTSYDLNVRLAGNPGTPPYAMDEAMQMQLAPGTSAQVRWRGEKTGEAAPRLLRGGHDGDGVYLATSNSEGSHIGHLHDDVQPASLMRSQSEETLDLSIVAYMLSDLGWGPVVDSRVRATASGMRVTATVTTSGLADNLKITAEVSGGFRISNVLGRPASCNGIGTSTASCTYGGPGGDGGLNAPEDAPVTILYDLAGPADAFYTVTIDADHQAPHVDPLPANNFAVTGKAFAAVTLSPAAVAENRPADTPVGDLAVTGLVAGLDYSFEPASGGMHNTCFRIDDNRLLTAKPFDRELVTHLNIRVRANASNGYSQEQDFRVTVTPETAAIGWTWSAAAYADGLLGTDDAHRLSLALLLALLAGGLLVGAGKSRRFGRKGRWGLAVLALLLAVSCGGGGSGNGTPDPPIEPPDPPDPPGAFTC